MHQVGTIGGKVQYNILAVGFHGFDVGIAVAPVAAVKAVLDGGYNVLGSNIGAVIELHAFAHDKLHGQAVLADFVALADTGQHVVAVFGIHQEEGVRDKVLSAVPAGAAVQVGAEPFGVVDGDGTLTVFIHGHAAVIVGGGVVTGRGIGVAGGVRRVAAARESGHEHHYAHKQRQDSLHWGSSLFLYLIRLCRYHLMLICRIGSSLPDAVHPRGNPWAVPRGSGLSHADSAQRSGIPWAGL